MSKQNRAEIEKPLRKKLGKPAGISCQNMLIILKRLELTHICSNNTHYSNMAGNVLFFYMYVNALLPSLSHFRLKFLLYFAYADEAKRANSHGYKRMIKWPPFWTKVYKNKLNKI